MSIDPKYYGLIEMGMTFGVVGIFTVQQLWSLRDKPSDKLRDKPDVAPRDDAGDTPEEPTPD